MKRVFVITYTLKDGRNFRSEDLCYLQRIVERNLDRIISVSFEEMGETVYKYLRDCRTEEEYKDFFGECYERITEIEEGQCDPKILP